MIKANELDIKVPVEGYESVYFVYNDGRVFSIRKNKFLKPELRGNYLAVTLAVEKVNKKFSLHRLVAINFIPNPLGKPCVNHIDGDKLNNVAENLEWVTYAENEQHSLSYLNKRRQHSNETRLKLSKAAKGRDMSLQILASVAARKGKPAHNRKQSLL